MSTSINTNISATAAQSSLRKTGIEQSTAMERLSTGIRINSARDDAAGLAISTRMTANIRGIAAAIRNANDGISLTQTAEGSLNAIGDNLQRIRELAVQSSNTGNNASDRAALNAESSQLIAEIDRVANNTAFNGIKLLDGSFQNQSLQVGSGNEANDRISISIGSAKANALGVGGGSSYSTKLSGLQVGSSALAANSLSINGIMVGGAGTDGVSFAYADTSGISVATAINSVSGPTGVTATVASTKTNTVLTSGVAAVAANSDFAAGEVTINGVDIGAVVAGGSPTAAGTNVAAAINAVSDKTGVTATSSSGILKLTASDGRDIVIGGTGTAAALLNDTGLVKGTTSAGTKVGPTHTAGAAVTAATALAANKMSINGVNIGAIGAGGAGNAAAQADLVVAAINLVADASGVTATQTAGTVTLYSKNGNDIVVKSATGDDVAGVLATTGLTAAATGTTTSFTTAAAIADDAIRINGVNIGAIAVANSKGERGSQMAAAINAKSSQTGVTATFSSDTGAVLLNATDGRNIITSINGSTSPITSSTTGLTHADGGQTVGTRTETVLRSVVSLSSNTSAGITIAGNTAAGLTATGLKAGATAASATQGAGVSTVDLSTATGSQAALTVLDKAINTVTDYRAAMGAYQNRLTASISNLETTSMNLQASRSRILDTDYAKETTNLAKSQIITQAATAMLAQANQSAQSVLALLK